MGTLLPLDVSLPAASVNIDIRLVLGEVRILPVHRTIPWQPEFRLQDVTNHHRFVTEIGWNTDATDELKCKLIELN